MMGNFSYKDNHLLYDENSDFELAIISDIGDREEQQDSFGYSIKSDSGLIVICDGMGGHQGGKFASSLAVQCYLNEYERYVEKFEPIVFFIETAKAVDKKIYDTRSADGSKLNAGTTIAATIIDNKDVNPKNTKADKPIDKSIGRIKLAIKASKRNIFIAAPQVIKPKSTPELSRIITS